MHNLQPGDIFQIEDDDNAIGHTVFRFLGTAPRYGVAIMLASNLLRDCCYHNMDETTAQCGLFRPDLASAVTRDVLSALPQPILDITKKLEGKKITREIFERWLLIAQMYTQHPAKMAQA